jgi:hypothetical protein
MQTITKDCTLTVFSLEVASIPAYKDVLDSPTRKYINKHGHSDTAATDKMGTLHVFTLTGNIATS